ncbi:MAG: hypothetical protein NC517_06085 [Firmicutes bacterium]|nr:hypothetical protein [Bacillota bacterium]
MRFVIDKAERQNDMTLVTGKTSVGTIKGIWKYRELPVINDSYHIELKIDHPCERRIPQGAQAIPYVCLEKEQVIFQGVCEDIDEEVYYIRLDTDWLEMLEINTVDSNKKIGDLISFSASVYGIGIFPYTL